MQQTKIVLASGSAFRGKQLQQLGINFFQQAANIDESRHCGESAYDLARRLSRQKAEKLYSVYPESIVIGSDQVIDCDDSIIGKPKTVKRAQQLLKEISGKKLLVYSGISVFSHYTGKKYEHVEKTVIQLRSLSQVAIQSYLEKEPDAIFCAGGIKSEGLGIVLIKDMISSDPHAVVGLPLYFLIEVLLVEEGVKIL